MAGITGARSLGGVSPSRLISFLPFLHHDLIYLELPGLRSFLIALGEENPALGEEVIAEAAASVGQQRPARRALYELAARFLERGGRGSLFQRVSALELPFLPSRQTLEPGHPILAIAAAAEDLRAAEVSSSHHHRRRALDRAWTSLVQAQATIGRQAKPDEERRRLLLTLEVWRDRVEEEQARLARAEEEQPQVPTPFVAGPVLRLEDRDLFRGRRDLIRIIDHDLSGDRRAPILLFGQRRMGKSSLLNMLPEQLGTGTRVITLNFQGLSGSAYRSAPHRWLAEEVATTAPGTREPPEEGPWGETLAWLREVDTRLAQDDSKLLIAIDEVERLEEDGTAAAKTEFLDFVRAAGDSLGHIRLLLAVAYLPHKLGAHWVDRLINAVIRPLRALDAAAARSLITEPLPNFPNIYPAGGVEEILDRTQRHPYLIQFVCDVLCRRLNNAGRLRATADDLEAAFDETLVEAPLFDELWRQRTGPEREILLAARGSAAVGRLPKVPLKDLQREGYVEIEDGQARIAVPLFATWLVENK